MGCSHGGRCVAPQLTPHPWRAPRVPRARAYAGGRRRCPCRRRAWRRVRRGRPAAGAGGRARRGCPPRWKTGLFQPASLFPCSQLAEAGRGWPTLGAAPGILSRWPSLLVAVLAEPWQAVLSTCAAHLEEHDLGRVHDRVQPVGDGEHRALLEGLADGRLQHRVRVVVDGGLVRVGLRVRAL